MSSSSKPAIVIVPGGWHSPSHYTPLHEALEKAGYNATTVKLPSIGPPEPLKDISQDVAAIRAAVKKCIDNGQNVVLVMHSFGGLIGSSAAKGYLAKDQPSGKGITSLCYVCAFAPQEGASLVKTNGGHHHAFVNVHDEMNSGGWCTPDNFDPRDIFYNDCSKEVQDDAVAKLKLWSENCCHSPCEYAAWKDVEANYLICTLDKAMPLAAQEHMSSQDGGKWKRVERLEASHSPFLSRPEETASFVRTCCGEDV